MKQNKTSELPKKECCTPLKEHSHEHGENCGHKAVKHDDHIDYEHDGHFHRIHGDHVHECSGPNGGVKK